MMNRHRVINIIGILIVLSGFLWATLLHVVIDAQTKQSVSNQVSKVRELERESITQGELESYVMDAIVHRANNVVTPLGPASVILVGVLLIIVSGSRWLK